MRHARTRKCLFDWAAAICTRSGLSHEVHMFSSSMVWTLVARSFALSAGIGLALLAAAALLQG